MANKESTRKQMIEERRRRREEAEKRAAAAKKKQTIGWIAGILGTALLLTLSIVLIMQPWGSGDGSKTDNNSYLDSWEFKHDMDVKHHVEIDVKDYGVIKLELDPTYAPVTVDNFLTLAEKGFYDGLTFHRIIDGFMIQGGDPNHDGTGGSNPKIKGEFSANGVTNPLAHKRGVISMARRSDSYDSGSCQFFIVHKDYPSLDGQYASFGMVTEGMDVVDAIVEAAEPGNNGAIVHEKQPIITKVKVID